MVNISDIAAWCSISFGDYYANPLIYALNLYLNGNKVTDLTIPNSVTSIGSFAFYGCSNLTSIVIPNSVTSIGNRAFAHCFDLTSVTIGNSVTSIGDGAFEDCSGLTSVTIGNSVTSIGEDAFWHCSSLTSVTIPNSMTSIGEGAFEDCTELSKVYISDIATWCSISFGDYYANPLIYAHNLYLNGNKVTDLIIPNSVTSIGDWAFWGCSLTSVTIPNSVTSIGEYAFHGCTGLTSIIIPNSVTSIGNRVFEYCSSLTSITIPNSVTSIGDWAFSGCTGLTFIDIPNSVTSIGYGAFEYCSSLTSATIGKGVTTIPKYCFSYCKNLTNIVIKGNLEFISEKAFRNCENLETFICYALNVPGSSDYSFSDTDITSATLYVPDESVDLYRSDPLFGRFGTIKGLSSLPKKAYAVYECHNDALWLDIYGLTNTGYGKLTFHYDENAANYEKVYLIDDGAETPSWQNTATNAELPSVSWVEFDKSFAEYKPKSTKRWFQGMKLWAVLGLENLNTSETTDMSYMFADFSLIPPMGVLAPEWKGYEYTAYTGFGGWQNMRDVFSVLDFSSAENLQGMFAGYNYSHLTLPALDIADNADCTGMFENSKIRFIEITPDFKGLPDNFLTGIGSSSPCVVKATEGFDFQTDTDTPSFLWMGGTFHGFQKEAYALLETNTEHSNYYYGQYDRKSDTQNEYKLTFFCDDQKYIRLYSSYAEIINDLNDPVHVEPLIVNEHTMEAFALNEQGESPAWLNIDYAGSLVLPDGYDPDEGGSPHKSSSTIDIAFDPSFADYRPKSTYRWFDFSYWKNSDEDPGVYYTQIKDDLCGISGLEYLNTSECQVMDKMFNGCLNIDSLDLSNFIIADNASTASMLEGCSGLKWLAANKSFEHLNDNACNGVGTTDTPCELIVPEDFDFGVTSTGNLLLWKNGYFSTTAEQYANVSSDGTTITFYYDNARDSRQGTTYTIDNTAATPEWLANAATITKAVFDPSFAFARPTTTLRWFSGMKNLKTIEGIENLNTSDVTMMSYMFLNCQSLETLDLSHFDTRKVDKMGYMLQGCTNLKSVDLTGFETSACTSFYKMFKNCSSLETLDLSPLTITEGVESRYMLNGCTGLKSLTIPETAANLNSSSFVTVGTSDAPCELHAPEGFDFGTDTNGTFQWKSGWFYLAVPAALTATVASLSPGSTASLTIGMTNGAATSYNGYEMVLTLPEGMTLAKSGSRFDCTIGDRYSSDDFSVSINDLGGGAYRIIGFSLSNTTITGSDGPLFLLKVTCPEGVATGNYTGTLEDISLSTTAGTGEEPEDVTFPITVSEYRLGDVDLNGKVNVVDVMLVVNRVLGETAANYHDEYADMDGNGKVNVVDIMTIIDVILTSPRTAPMPLAALMSYNSHLILSPMTLSPVTSTAKGSTSGGIILSLDGTERFTACQMDVRLDGSTTLRGIKLLGTNASTHNVKYFHIGDDLWRVVVYSTKGAALESNAPLLQLITNGSQHASIENIEMCNTAFDTVTLDCMEGSATGIAGTATDADTQHVPIFTIQGIRTDQPQRGVNIRNGVKLIVK